jgi:hypothetical protein
MIDSGKRKTNQWSARHVSGSGLAESTSSRQVVPKIETGKQSVLPVGRISQQNSARRSNWNANHIWIA